MQIQKKIGFFTLIYLLMSDQEKKKYESYDEKLS